MRRPLFVVALCLVIIAAIRLETGTVSRVRDGCISANELVAAEEIMVAGQVYQKDEQSIYIKSVVLLDSNISESSAANSRQEISIQDNFICETELASQFPLGSIVTLSGIFAPFSPATNPGEFDSAVYYRTLGIGGKIKQAVILSRSEEYWRVREALYHLKVYFKERLYRIFPEKEAAIMSALLLGDKEDLDSELKELYKRNGILHVLSISSLHITIIGMSLYKLLRKAGAPAWAAAAAGGTLLLLYGCMTGFGVSACRAIGMYLIRMLGEAVGRTYDLLIALGVLAAVMVTINPYYLQNGGFLLSFGCVLGIGAVYPALMPKLSRVGKSRLHLACIQAVLRSLFSGLSVTLTTLPIQLYLFYEVPVYSIFLNLLVIPLVKPMMITGLLALLVPGLGIIHIVPTAILKSYEFLCSLFDRLPFHTWNPGCPNAWQIVVYYILLFGVVVLRNYVKRKPQGNAKPRGSAKTRGSAKRRGKHRKAVVQNVFCRNSEAAVSVCALSLAVFLLGIGAPAENRVTFMDVGQGDCILVQTASGENYLFDCGSSSRTSVGKYILIPYLKYNGIRTIDAVFVSHPDTDHTNGILELLALGAENGISVEQLVLPGIEASAGAEHFEELLQAVADVPREKLTQNPIRVGYISSGDSWECESASFLCLHPKAGYSPEDKNAYSQCIYVEFSESGENAGSGWSLLLTGDVGGNGEEALLEELSARKIEDVTVLKAAHHGSRHSTSEELLWQINPALTVISCGKNNSYGHPHKEVLKRLEIVGSEVLTTPKYGAITVEIRQIAQRD